MAHPRLIATLSFLCVGLILGVCGSPAHAQETAPGFRGLVLAERGGVHGPFVDAAKIWLNQLAAEKNFAIDYLEDTKQIDETYLDRHAVFIQLNYPPYAWTPTAAAAFEKYITQGKGGWVGLHHASLLGEFDGYKLWPWFDTFMGGIIWKDYIPTFAAGTVTVEDRKHPVMTGVPEKFTIKKEEWYTYDKSPRSNVHVLASVDEATYVPDSKVKMGDHPVIWTNDKIAARNVYIFMGHSPVLLDDNAFKMIFRNAILWAAAK